MTTTIAVPENRDAERAVLGAVLINPTALPCLAGLRPEHFLDHRHRAIWQAVCDAASAGAVDVLTVTARMNGSGDGGYLVGLLAEVPTSLHAEAYAAQVIAAARARGWLSDAQGLAHAAIEKDEQAARRVLDTARLRFQDVPRDGLECAAQVASRLWDELADTDRLKAVIRPTGLAALDEALGGGPEPGTQTIIMARPSMGKTALMVQVSDLVSERGERVLVLTKEHLAASWQRRMAFRRARANWLAFKQGHGDPDISVRVLTELQGIGSRSALLFDDSAETSEQAMDACRRAADRLGGLDWVLADHLRLFRDRDEREVRRLGRISENLREIARELGARGIVAAQLNRAVEAQSDKRPDLKDLRDSGEIEENADNVIGLYRDKYYKPASPKGNTAELWIRKARDGERDVLVEMAFLTPHMSFEPLQKAGNGHHYPYDA